MYADLALDNTPRSRQPVQVYEVSDLYGEIPSQQNGPPSQLDPNDYMNTLNSNYPDIHSLSPSTQQIDNNPYNDYPTLQSQMRLDEQNNYSQNYPSPISGQYTDA